MLWKLACLVRENFVSCIFALGLAMAVIPSCHALGVKYAHARIVDDPTAFPVFITKSIDFQYEIAQSRAYGKLVSFAILAGLSICSSLIWLAQREQAWLRRLLRQQARRREPAKETGFDKDHSIIQKKRPPVPHWRKSLFKIGLDVIAGILVVGAVHALPLEASEFIVAAMLLWAFMAWIIKQTVKMASGKVRPEDQQNIG